MAVFVTTGKNNGVNRCKSRFGGESAWRQHSDRSFKLSTLAARQRAESKHVKALMGDLDDLDEVQPSSHRCPNTGISVPVMNGVVREGNIVLVYAKGKLLSAHCG